MISFLLRAAPALILVGLSLSAGSAFAAFAITQAPCTTAPGWCVRFGGAAVPGTVRSFTFNAPGAGVAVATFHGSLNCVNTSVSRATIDLVSQIVDSAAAPVLQNGPGGLRHLALLPPQSGGQNAAETFNLASTRALSITAAGSQTLNFKLRRLRMDAGTACYLYNAVFTVTFAP